MSQLLDQSKKFRFSLVAAGGLWLLLLLGLGTAGCAIPVTVHRAALVQPPTPPTWSGRNQATGVTAGSSTVLWHSAPKKAEESTSGLYVSRVQFDGNLHIQLGPTNRVSLWVPLSMGLNQGPMATTNCQIEPPTSSTFTYGIGVGLSRELSSTWYIGTSFETTLSSIPSHIETYSTITGTKLNDEQDNELIPILRWSGVVGLNLGTMRVFGAVGLRNHPTNEQVSLEYLEADQDGEVRFGPMYALVGVGAEIDLGQNVTLQSHLYQPLDTGEAVLNYGPILGVTLDLHAPRKAETE